MSLFLKIAAGLIASIVVIEPAMAQTAVAFASSSDLPLIGLGLFGAVLGQRAGRKQEA